MNRKLYWTKSKNPFERLKNQEFDNVEVMTPINVSMTETPIGIVGDIEDLLQDDDHLWVGHSNFDITAEDIYSIEGIPGVEGLRPLTRYRFQVAIGLMFSEDNVKQNIEDTLCKNVDSGQIVEIVNAAKRNNPQLPKDLEEKIDQQIKAIKEKYWVIYMLPNGEVKVLSSNDLDHDFAGEVAVFYSSFLFVGGYFVSNIGV